MYRAGRHYVFLFFFIHRKETALIILTNNPDVAQTFQDRNVLWVDGSYRDVLIENAIETFDKFAQVTRPDRGVNTPERMLADFRLIDLSLIESALEDR